MFDVVWQSSASGVDTPSGTPLNGLRAFVDLVTTIGSLLERLHTTSSYATSDSIETVLTLDSELDTLRERLGRLDTDLGESQSAEALKRTAVAGSVLRQIHYNWQVSSSSFLESRADCAGQGSLCEPHFSRIPCYATRHYLSVLDLPYHCFSLIVM